MSSLDSKKSLLNHYKIIRNKPFLKKIYFDFYKMFKKVKIPPGKIVELGSGAGFIKEVIPKAITTDIISGPNIDILLKNDLLPFSKNSVAAFFLLNVFHHIKDPEKTITQMQGCLKKGGKIITIEPYNSFWGRFIYQNFHHERFDPKGNWKIKGRGRLSMANGAVPWIIFVRDRELFEMKFPNLKISKISPHTPLRYLLSGGLSKPQFIPTFTYNLILALERFFSPLNKHFSMFVTIEIVKSS